MAHLAPVADMVSLDPNFSLTILNNDNSIIERNLQHMRFQLLLSVGVTAVIVSYIMYVVVKKGSKIGEDLRVL